MIYTTYCNKIFITTAEFNVLSSGEVVFHGIRNSGITELRNKQISTLTIFHYMRLYCIIIQVVSEVVSMIFPVLKY